MTDLPHPKRLRVLFLNRSYWPDAEATGQLLTELCEDLAIDFDVEVIAGQPNQNPANIAFRRQGLEVRHGVAIRRVFNFRFSKSKLIGRAVNLLSYLFTSTFTALWSRRPDVVVVETDPPLLCYLGILLRWRFGAKLIIYLQDIYPDVALKLGKLSNGIFYRFLRRTMHGAYRRSDRVIVLSEDMRNLLLRSRVTPEKITIVPNWVDTRSILPVKDGNLFRETLGPSGAFIVMYSGNLGLTQRLEHFLEAANLLRDESDVHFVLIGDGATKADLQTRAQQLALENVRFLGYQPKAELAASLSAADLHFVVLDPAIDECLMPSKIYGILASGTPVLVAARPDCELAQLVRTHRVGMVVDFGDSRAIAEKIAWACEHPEELAEMGRCARLLAVEQYDRQYITHRFGEVLLETAGEARRPAGAVADQAGTLS